MIFSLFIAVQSVKTASPYAYLVICPFDFLIIIRIETRIHLTVSCFYDKMYRDNLVISAHIVAPLIGLETGN